MKNGLAAAEKLQMQAKLVPFIILCRKNTRHLTYTYVNMTCRCTYVNIYLAYRCTSTKPCPACRCTHSHTSPYLACRCIFRWRKNTRQRARNRRLAGNLVRTSRADRALDSWDPRARSDRCSVRPRGHRREEANCLVDTSRDSLDDNRIRRSLCGRRYRLGGCGMMQCVHS